MTIKRNDNSLELIGSLDRDCTSKIELAILSTNEESFTIRLIISIPFNSAAVPSNEFRWTSVASREEIVRFVESLEGAYESLSGTAELCTFDCGPYGLLLFTAVGGAGHFVIGGKFEHGHSSDQQVEDLGRLSELRSTGTASVFMFEGLMIDQSYLPRLISFFREALAGSKLFP